MRIWICLFALTAFAIADGDPPQAGDVDVETEIDVKEVAKRLGSRDVTERYEAAGAAARIQDPAVLRPLTKLLKDKEQAVREAAIQALRNRQDPKQRKHAASSLAARIKPLSDKEGREEEVVLVCNALHDLAQRESIKPLLSNVSTDSNQEEIRARLRAVANVPHADAIEALLRFASSGRKRSRRSKWAQQALAYATGEKENKSLDEWRRWWTDNKKSFDFEAAAALRAERRASGAEQKAKKKKKNRRNKLEEE